MEIWDLFDENRQPLNKTHNRQDEMKIGEFHVFAEIWTVNDDNEILLTLRHPDKKIFPNYWENTMGAVLSGENSRTGAVRELYEETGIIADENELLFLGTMRVETFFIDTYITRKNYKTSELTLQEGETVDAQWVTLDKLDEMIRSEAATPTAGIRLAPLRKDFEKFLYGK